MQFLVYLQAHVQCVMYTVQCAACQRWKFCIWNMISQIFWIACQEHISLNVLFYDGLRLLVFLKGENGFLIWLIWNNCFKSFCVTPPSECRLFTKSTFLVIDINSMYNHTPKVGDKLLFLIPKSWNGQREWFFGFLIYIHIGSSSVTF